jgi:hypothetical protein
MVPFSAFCCCLPIGLIISVILELAGAVGYTLIAGKLEKKAGPGL